MKKPTYKELEEKLLRNERSHLKTSIIIFLIVTIAALYITVHYTKVEKELDNLKHLGSVYTDTEGNAFIRFNNTDQHQQALLKEIQAYCLRNQLTRCMPSYEAILAEGRK